MKTAIVIGAGVGGLAAAIQLARAGVRVRLFERGSQVGGKLREIDLGGRKILGGPSVLTMRWVFDELFDGRLADYVTLTPVDPLCRHFFADGSQLDLFTDGDQSREAIRRFAGNRDADGYMKFRKQAHKIFDIVRKPFMEEAVPSLFDFMSPRSLWQLTQIDGLRTLMRAVEDYFVDPRLRQLFARYATYNGSSPYHAPATLAVIAHVENAHGIFGVAGGIYRLAEALERRARELGVDIVTDSDVEEIVVEPSGGPLATALRARGVRVNGGVEWADCVVANCDIADAYGRLLADVAPARKQIQKYAEEELSLSAYVLLALAPKPQTPALVHHNVFFSSDYAREFRQLVDERRPPDDPTVYVCHERATHDDDSNEAPYFILTNAPPLADKSAIQTIDWNIEAARCRERIERVLARHGWTLTPSATNELTPRDFAQRFPSSRGAIYGLASNSRLAAFKRPANTFPNISGIYFCGGSVHPGAGLPMVALSARIATRLALTNEWKDTERA
ncbi:MAG TPA: phytoene desaturase family protein [Polyangia bacterium]|nr:phytoene desaturase family protein [Polyangia bacterium]